LCQIQRHSERQALEDRLLSSKIRSLVKLAASRPLALQHR
jgi:hypothetical protein